MYCTPQLAPSRKGAKISTHFGFFHSKSYCHFRIFGWHLDDTEVESVYDTEILTKQRWSLLIPVSALETQAHSFATPHVVLTHVVVLTIKSLNAWWPPHCLALVWIFLLMTFWVIALAGMECWQWPTSHWSSLSNIHKWERISGNYWDVPV